jgi:hypothetical protein
MRSTANEGPGVLYAGWFGSAKGMEVAMSSVPLKQEIHQMLDELPPEVLPELVDFLDFLRFRASREVSGSRVQEAIRLYVAEEVSLGRAAELAGMNYFLFEELLHRQGIPVVEPEVVSEAGQAAQREIADEILA